MINQKTKNELYKIVENWLELGSENFTDIKERSDGESIATLNGEYNITTLVSELLNLIDAPCK